MQPVLFQVLQQRPAVAMHDALGSACGSRGKHDVKRLIEFDRNESEILAGDRKIRPVNRLGEGQIGRQAVGKRHDHDLFDGRYLLHNPCHNSARIADLAIVEVTVRGEQDGRFDLAEAVNDAGDAKIGGA